MADGDKATDETSIKPVSSLRSRFENMNLGQPQPAPALAPAANVRRSLDLPRQAMSLNPPTRPDNPPNDTPESSKKLKPPPPKPRPVSTVYPMTPRQSPPTVSVQSPASPAKNFDVRLTTATPTKTPPSTASTPASANVSPAGSLRHFRSPSRATTPALEARMSAFLQASQPSEPHVDTDQRSKSPHLGHPPPINRAGKPKLGNLPSVSVECLAPHDTHESQADRISPFSTPPSSLENPPAAELAPSAVPSISKPNSQSLHGYFTGVTAPRHTPEKPRIKPPRPVSHYEQSRFQKQSQNKDGANDEQLPQLPPRPDREPSTGRTSPLRPLRIPARQSLEIPRRPSTAVVEPNSHTMQPPRRPQPPMLQTSASSQGFDRRHSATPALKLQPPTIPAPRRSADIRRDEIRTAPSTPILNGHADDYDDPPINYPGGNPQEFPDASQANRRPPRFNRRPWEIATGYDTRLFAVCGDLVCTTGYITRVWSLRTGESCLTLPHSDNVKVTALAFKPASDIEDEGKRLWLGTNLGEIHEVDIATQSVIYTKSNAHPRREVIKMFRHASELWSLDDEGKLNIWPAGPAGIPSLESNPRGFRTPRGHSFSLTIGANLWLATGKEIRVFRPSATSEADFQVLPKPLIQETAGDVTCGAIIPSKPDLVYFGHADGKVSVYRYREFKCIGVFNISPYKISSLAGTGDYLWAGYTAGMIYVYDTSTTPWRVMKDWPAHDKPICNIISDRQSIWKMDRLQVVSLGLDNSLKIWDGMLRDDWLESQMQQHDSEFCNFEDMTAAVLTWNAGASKPHYLKNNGKDGNFFRDYLSSHDPPDIFVFGFQELVDLEDKKVTAKSFFKSKKKAPDEQEHMSHQYRAWRDHLTRCIEDFMPADQGYSLLHTSSMVGLFSCVFVKTPLRSRIKYVHTAQVKRGMGGLHGNKGALLIRMILDDSSVCLINCHLAAGQTHTISRNNDIAAILESECLPLIAGNNMVGTFVGGGDGSMILDHEICILNGDLNYRIDAMPRDTVVRNVREKNLAKLLDRDQLLLSRRKNPAFRLRVFQELPITFDPTYKYNVGTDEYDTSEKKRSPAWCDRVLFRGTGGRIKCEDYRRWEVKVSDHRPVSAHLRIRVKKVDDQKRVIAWDKREKEFEKYSQRIAGEAELDYLTNVLGLPRQEAVNLLQG